MAEMPEADLRQVREILIAVLKLNSDIVLRMTRGSTDLRREAVQAFRQNRDQCRDREVGEVWDREIAHLESDDLYLDQWKLAHPR